MSWRKSLSLAEHALLATVTLAGLNTLFSEGVQGVARDDRGSESLGTSLQRNLNDYDRTGRPFIHSLWSDAAVSPGQPRSAPVSPGQPGSRGRDAGARGGPAPRRRVMPGH